MRQSVSLFCALVSRKLTAHNHARKYNGGEPPVDENDPSIYAMENKSGWRIDGAKWKDVCSLASCLMLIRDLVYESLKSFLEHHPHSKSKMQSIKIFNTWMWEWASNLVVTYKQPDIRKQLEVCLDCLADSGATSVEWAKAPEVLAEYLKDHYESFYLFHFPSTAEVESDATNTEEELDSQGRPNRKDSLGTTDSENEFQDKGSHTKSGQLHHRTSQMKGGKL